jgi:hypothetical protein
MKATDKEFKENAREKRPLSAYNCFMKAEPGEVKGATVGVSHKEAFKQVAAKWSAMTKDQKAQYVRVTVPARELC